MNHSQHKEDQGQSQLPKIVIAGASGYIGGNLIKELMNDAQIIALTRKVSSQQQANQQVTWRTCDLFSMLEAEECLRGADYAVYLVHSMIPSARLTQGSFQDMDVILADNFAQAAVKAGVKQIVYLSGLIPNTEHLSRHLKSRLEVEQVLSSYTVPVTTLRAGLIVGPRGSSFPILVKLVKRLPIMLLPQWTQTKTHPIALVDVIHALQQCIGHTPVYHKIIDLGGPEVMTYKEMMVLTAKALGKTRYLLQIPYFTVTLSRLWVSLTTQTPKNLVYPLIESLIHPMTAQPERMVEGISFGKTPFLQSAIDAIHIENELINHQSKQPYQRKSSTSSVQEDTVRSVQRLYVPEGRDAVWVAMHYIKWLAYFLKPLIRVEIEDTHNCRLYALIGKKPLLELTFSEIRSTPLRALFYITGGKLASTRGSHPGRMEFRFIPGTNACMAAIHDFMPALPWFIYKYTQAKMHLWVMSRFKKHLLRMSKDASSAKNMI